MSKNRFQYLWWHPCFNCSCCKSMPEYMRCYPWKIITCCMNPFYYPVYFSLYAFPANSSPFSLQNRYLSIFHFQHPIITLCLNVKKNISRQWDISFRCSGLWCIFYVALPLYPLYVRRTCSTYSFYLHLNTLIPAFPHVLSRYEA